MLDRRIPVTWIVAAIIGILWHVMWVVWLNPRPAQAMDLAIRPTRATYLRLPAFEPGEGGDKHAIRSLWSPVLFALPTPYGFSQEVLDQEVDMVPPLEAPAASSVYLERSRDGERAASEPPIVRSGAGDVQLSALVRAGAKQPVFPTAAVTEQDLNWSIVGGDFREEHILDAPLPAGDIVFSEASWDAVVYVEVDPDGIVTDVIMDSATRSGYRNRALLAAVRQWRFAVSDTPRRGKIALYHRSVKHAESSLRGMAP